MTNPAPALILVKNGSPLTTSLLVAERFGKQHKNVLRNIEALIKDEPEFSRLNFEPISYKDASGRGQKHYEMTEEGFAMIAMSFTGKEARSWKIKFISAFQKMRKHLERVGKIYKTPEWQELREYSRLGFKFMNSTLQERRALQGKESKQHVFINEAKLINSIISDQFRGLDRDNLSKSDLFLISELQRINTMLIAQDIAYQERKAALFNRAALISQQKRLTNG